METKECSWLSECHVLKMLCHFQTSGSGWIYSNSQITHPQLTQKLWNQYLQVATYNIILSTAVLKPITPNPSCEVYQWGFGIYGIRKHFTKQDISLCYTLKDMFALFSAMHSNHTAPAYALLGQLNLQFEDQSAIVLIILQCYQYLWLYSFKWWTGA